MATADCGCTARVEASGDDLSLSLCDCTDSCDDVITPYQAHAVGPARSIGEHPRSLGGAAAPLSVRAPDECYPLPALGLHVELPDPSARQVGPPLVWVGIDGEQGLCCADPLPAVRGEVAPDGVIDLTLYSCVQEDCFCLPDAPTPFTAWYSLGPVPPGDYVIVAGSERARFHVP